MCEPSIPLDQALVDEITAIRHELHRTPELSDQEHHTTARLKELLQSHGIRVFDLPLATGVVAQIDALHAAPDAPTVALRADIDGLPVTEEPNYSEISQHQGVMHACGHDLHMAGLLGAAFYLQQHRDELDGNVRLFFQPAEETHSGAVQVIAAGGLHGVDAVIGYHNTPTLKPGELATGVRPMMSGNNHFSVVLHAKGTHAAYPENGRSPVEAMASMVLALQTIVSRNVPPLESAVLSITETHAGSVWNVIPAEARFGGTMRAFNVEVMDTIRKRFFGIVNSIAQAYDITAEINWPDPAIPLINDPHLAALAEAAVPQYAKLADLVPSMASEDFPEYTVVNSDRTGKPIPGVFAFVGSNGAEGAVSWHSPKFLGLDETLPTAVRWYIATTRVVLADLAQSSAN